MTQLRVENLVQDLSLVNPVNHEMVQTIRKMVLDLAADVREEVKYGGILFSAHTSFCGVFSYSGHISIEFGDGAKLDDTYAVLEGKGKFRRHIKCFTMNDLERLHLYHYLKLAYQTQAAQ